MSVARWTLPAGVEEILPPDSWRLEALRRRLLDRYREAGFELVIPALVEHLPPAGADGDLDAQALKLTDPVSGRLLRVRADMTPQAARIAAHRFRDVAVVRLCYLGSVLRAEAESPGGPRALIQVGCEIFGQSDLAADLEVLELMLLTLSTAGVAAPSVGLGHAGIYRALSGSLALQPDEERLLFDILQRKSHPDLVEFFDARNDAAAAADFSVLMDLNGDAQVPAQARRRLPRLPPIDDALSQIERAAAKLEQLRPRVGVQIDLAELRGYRYESGLVFSAFVSGCGHELARGGRYDGTGGEYGRAMSATGFSADLNELLRLEAGGQSTSTPGREGAT